MLHLQVVYQLEDTLTGDKYEVTRFTCSYKIEVDGKVESIESLYPACQHAVGALRMWLEMHSRAHKTPGANISCPPLSHLQNDLQESVNWFDSH